MTVYIHPPVPYGNIILQWTLLHNISNTYDVVNYTYRFRLVAEGRLLWRGTSILSSNQLRASGPFLRCWHSQSLGRTSHYHVHTASPSATCTRSTSFQSHVLKIHFNIILPSIAACIRTLLEVLTFPVTRPYESLPCPYSQPLSHMHSVNILSISRPQNTF